MAGAASSLRVAIAIFGCVCAWLSWADVSPTAASAFDTSSSATGVMNGNCAASAPIENASAPLVVEVSDEYGPYRGDHVVMVSDSSGLPLVTLACTGPHDAVVLAPGSYRVMAFIHDVRSQELVVNVPPNGTSVALKLEPAPGAPPRGPNVL